MNNKKVFRIVLAGVLVFFGIGLGAIDTQAQYKLELNENQVTILDESENEVSLDSIKSDMGIIYIKISYDGRKSDNLRIWGTEGLILNKAATNSLDSAEIQKAVGTELVLKANQDYAVQHGDKLWKLSRIALPDLSSASDATPEKEVSNEKEEHSGAIMLYILLGLFVITSLVLGGLSFILSRRLKQICKTCDKDSVFHENQDKDLNSDKSDEVQNPANPVEEKSEHTLTAEEVIDELCKDTFGFTLEQKRVHLKNKIQSYANSLDILKGIGKRLGVNDVEAQDWYIRICNQIDDLSNSNDQTEHEVELIEKDRASERESDNNSAKEIYATLKDCCIKNYELKEIVIRSEKKFKNSENSEKEILIDVITNLPKFDKQKSQINIDSNVITDAQLKSSVNQYKLKSWLIDKLKQFAIPVSSTLDPTDSILENLSQLLKEATQTLSEKTNRKSDEEIVSVAIAEDKLQDKDRRVLLERFIGEVNSQLPDNTGKLKSNISKDGFIELIVEKMSTPVESDEAVNQTKERIIGIINDVFGSELKELNKEQIKSIADQAIVGVVKKGLSIPVSNIDEANYKLRNVRLTLEKFGVEDPSQLEEAIIAERYKQLEKSVAQDVEKLLPDQHFESTHALVNALIKEVRDKQKAYKEVLDDDEMVKDALEEYIAEKNQNIDLKNKTLLKLIDVYYNEVKTQENSLQKEIGKLKEANETANEKLNEKELENVSLTNNKNALEDKLAFESSEMVDYLHSGADRIRAAWRPILKGCSEEDENQCIDIEDRLRNSLFESLKEFDRFQPADKLTPIKTRKEIQDLLIERLTAENSPFNVIGRYYAYSRLPFMTDTGREYGVIFNRKNIGDLYCAMEALYVYFGINLEIPVLFAIGFEEGDFINVTGQAYGDLDNLCQNSRNHFDNIDSKNKPSDVIVDLVHIGYTLTDRHSDGKKPSVLTY